MLYFKCYFCYAYLIIFTVHASVESVGGDRSAVVNDGVVNARLASQLAEGPGEDTRGKYT